MGRARTVVEAVKCLIHGLRGCTSCNALLLGEGAIKLQHLQHAIACGYTHELTICAVCDR